MHTQYAKHFEILLNENCCMHVKYYNGKQKSLKFHLMKPVTVWDALLSMNKWFFSNEYLKIDSKIYPSVIYSNKKHKIFFLVSSFLQIYMGNHSYVSMLEIGKNFIKTMYVLSKHSNDK